MIVIPSYVAKGLEFDSTIIYTDKSNTYRDKEWFEDWRCDVILSFCHAAFVFLSNILYPLLLFK